MKRTGSGGTMSNGALSDCARPCNPGDRAPLALSEPNWVGTATRRHRDQAGWCHILFPTGDVLGFESAVQSDPLGREPLKRLSPTKHRREFVTLPGGPEIRASGSAIRGQLGPTARQDLTLACVICDGASAAAIRARAARSF